MCGEGADFAPTEVIEINKVARIVDDAISGIGMPSFKVRYVRYKVCPLGGIASVGIADVMAVEIKDSQLIAVDYARRVEWGNCG